MFSSYSYSLMFRSVYFPYILSIHFFHLNTTDILRHIRIFTYLVQRVWCHSSHCPGVAVFQNSLWQDSQVEPGVEQMLEVSHHRDLVDLLPDLVVGDVVPHPDCVRPNGKCCQKNICSWRMNGVFKNIFSENFKENSIPKAWFYGSQLDSYFWQYFKL